MTPRALALTGVLLLVAAGARAATTSDSPPDSDSPIYSDVPEELKQSLSTSKNEPDPALLQDKLEQKASEAKKLIQSGQAGLDTILKSDPGAAENGLQKLGGPQSSTPVSPLNPGSAPARPARSSGSRSSGGRYYGSAGGPKQTDASVSEPAPADDGDAVSNSATAQKGRKAFVKARSLADGFKSTIKTVDSSPEGGLAAAAAGARPSPDREPGGDPARPKTDADLALAATTGFKASFAAVGLKVGQDKRGRTMIVDAAGKPATPSQLDTLRRQIRSDPTALEQYPDLFKTVPRERFARLETEFSSRPSYQGTFFKDIGMTEERRDFEWTRTCEKIDGGCNAHARSESYRKGDKVPPEDLDKIWGDIEAEVARDDAAQADGAPGSRLRIKLKLPGGVVGSFDQASPEDGNAVGTTGPAASLAAAIRWPFGRARRPAPAGATAAPTARRETAPVPAAAPAEASPRGGWAAVAGLGGLTVIFGFLLARRRNGDDD